MQQEQLGPYSEIKRENITKKKISVIRQIPAKEIKFWLKEDYSDKILKGRM